MEPKTFVIVDDMEATHACLVIAWFAHKSHHYNKSMVKNAFDKDPSRRIISLNVTHIILLKIPRDISQVFQAVYLSGNGILMAAYWDATATRAHSYMVIDFK